jgi:AraC-like DNA-binding protein
MFTWLDSYARETEGTRLYLAGWREGLADQIDHRFERWAAMFIFRGSGHFEHAGRTQALQAPCLFLARPGERYRYGPDGTWDEFHMVFATPPPRLDLTEWPAGPMPIAAPDTVWGFVEAALPLMRDPAAVGVADQLDALAPVLLMAARYGHGAEPADGPLKRIYEAEQWIRRHLAEEFELGDLAARFGFSPATFRRWWNRRFDLSPWQYVIELRMQQARHLLLTYPHMPVSRVARRVGYDDPRYFSTAFRRATGHTPTAYRHRGHPG